MQGEFQGFCWHEEPPEGICGDRFDPVDPALALTVQAGETLTLRFDRPLVPSEGIVVARYDRPPSFESQLTSEFAVAPGNPLRFTADLPLGTSFLRIETHWQQGSAIYVFELTVVAPGQSCTGLSATISGTSGRDTLVGTPGPDVILAGGGNDVVVGLGGDDLLCGGEGGDVVLGGEGSDRIVAEAGDDIALGQNGDDTILGGPGRDRLRGGPGADALAGGADVDLCAGHLGWDATSGCEWSLGVP